MPQRNTVTWLSLIELCKYVDKPKWSTSRASPEQIFFASFSWDIYASLLFYITGLISISTTSEFGLLSACAKEICYKYALSTMILLGAKLYFVGLFVPSWYMNVEKFYNGVNQVVS